ncbi:MAG: preprotein translocase subunit SecD [Parcubacteria group bacterium Gr01-1014_30]|nr:MAG: preprotein translocase subunit SecD [Parcubacteria group bacterium Gr01-1014_30]
MEKTGVYVIVIGIIVLAFFAGNFAWPQLLNLGFVPNVPYKLGLDLQGGVHLVYEAGLSQIAQADRADAMEGLRDVIERRVNLFGVREPVVHVQRNRLVVELAGVLEPAKAIRLIGETPFLEFRELSQEAERQEEELIEFTPTPLTGRYLQKAEVVFEQLAYRPTISLQFNQEGAKIFEEITAQNVGKPVAIYIDGVLISAPVVQEPISGGKAQITGQFTIAQAQELARNLNAGALPLPITLISEQSVGPTLGAVSLAQSLRAGILGFLAILLFMIGFYRIPGLLSSISLLIYVVLLLALFKLISVTLTLAGIAGLLLSMGMAVDANVLIFSRVREELKQGKNYLHALEEGIKRAWPAIRDGNLTTILVGLILFGFGTSFVKGFAFTLVIGNLVGMFTAIVVTNNLLRLFPKDKNLKWFWLWF